MAYFADAGTIFRIRWHKGIRTGEYDGLQAVVRRFYTSCSDQFAARLLLKMWIMAVAAFVALVSGGGGWGTDVVMTGSAENVYGPRFGERLA